MKFTKSPVRQHGQGMTEYIIIVALIAIAAIGVYKFLGTAVRSQTSAIANEIAGKDGKDAIAAAASAAEATTKERESKSLANYNGGNSTNAAGGGK